MAIRGLLIQTGIVYRKTTVLSGGRGKSEVTVAAVTQSSGDTSVRCNIQLSEERREEYRLADRGERSYTSVLGFFEYGTDIKEGDQFTLSTGETFHVDRGHPDVVGRQHHLECDLELIRGV